jgi:hypothetical protein
MMRMNHVEMYFLNPYSTKFVSDYSTATGLKKSRNILDDEDTG